MGESSGSKRREAREFWEAAIRLWAESGLSVRDFCRQEGLAEHTFYSWRRELLPKSPPPNAAGNDTSTVEFVPVRVVAENMALAQRASAEPAAGTPPIEIVHRSGWSVHIPDGFDPTTLDAVLTVLERRPC